MIVRPRIRYRGLMQDVIEIPTSQAIQITGVINITAYHFTTEGDQVSPVPQTYQIAITETFIVSETVKYNHFCLWPATLNCQCEVTANKSGTARNQYFFTIKLQH